MRTVTVIAAAAVLAVTGCSDTVVNTGQWETVTPTQTSTAPPLPPTDPAHMANAFTYFVRQDNKPVYYFTTPSGRWQCAILPRDMAGCQSSAGTLDIAGAPATVSDAAGAEVPPNAIVIEPDGDTKFAVLDQPGFTLLPGPANVLPFNRTLIAARFRCNVQAATGLSCLSEKSGKGFTFSADGFVPQYTEVPLDAP